MKYLAIALLVVPLLLAATLYGLTMILGKDLPTPESPHEVEPSVASTIMDRSGERVDLLFAENRTPLTLAQVPPEFLKAILAVEDRHFYKHWGLNPISILRALKEDLLQGRAAQGASTITQQLARNLFLDHRRTVERKIREAILALRIERSFSKDEILELYVNQIYFGEGAYGLAAASRRFFGIEAEDLTLEQCALLAGLPGNPAAFSPRRHPEAALGRRNRVLRAMAETGAIDMGTCARACDEPLVLREASSGHAKPGAYFVEMVRQELMRRHGSSAVYHAGMRVETTLDLKLQRVAEEALERHLRDIEQRNDYPYLSGRADATLAEYGLPREAELPSRLRLQGAVVAIELATGAVRALVGGRDFTESVWNRAVQAPRQPASSFKPFIYAEAIRRGYRTTDILLDEPAQFPIPGYATADSVWSPRNFDETFFGPVTLRFALAKSINVPTARLLDALGVASVIDLAHKTGIQSSLPPVLSLATGSGEVNLLEMTSAFSVFGNQGIRVEPYLIERIYDRYGHAVETHTPSSAQVLDPQTCYLVTSMLSSALDFGTAGSARAEAGLRMPAAGKTGTNDDYTDAWFIGYTPTLAVGVWVGFDWRIPIGGSSTGTGSKAALPIWTEIMKEVERRGEFRDFDLPAGITLIRTCRETGYLAGPDCPNVVLDAFRTGSEPAETCPLHRWGSAFPEDSETPERGRAGARH
ncbi:MAG: PBP1A family penicillin-binding protein [Candidatus Eisenbacteria bacterium]